MLQGYNIVDFAGPIGLLCVLIVGVGEIRRWLSSPQQAQYVLGAIFGLVAVIEMEMPISPFEGVIIDLRIVPVILAGAFLGWRGLAVCLVMAIATRVYTGGVGASSGIAGAERRGTFRSAAIRRVHRVFPGDVLRRAAALICREPSGQRLAPESRFVVCQA
ncbi:LytS/YhcK type 5TM receptor domain-containing protein [Primorskyibacter marinus]|uniref:LytS/YhcK type 5TM receptor domain-containing protein n=1 Tax=Primorskyibacter marinus TaxID=1977320 RepID=UPI000E30301E|nr:LytS/YhcK type 5TM receptor domain-containing protein [Primorskyibacter marinus]